jgi:serine phosphatase RsbU (regulator of sigma subunit)
LSSGITFYLVRINAVKRQNQILEQKVVNRTHELEKKSQEIAKKSKDLELANHEIKAKNEALQTSEEELRQNMEELAMNQEILKAQKGQLENAFLQLRQQNTKVNDSIRYAKRIQNAVLPHENILDIAFNEHFVILKPKDVVSGDFYWYLEVENKKFLAIVDCTGHGVPGAFMSMIGNTLLYEIINAKHILEPHHILEQLNWGILHSLNKKDAQMQDGMDIALCCIENQANGMVKVQFSGAKRSLYYFSNNELIQVQADRKSIGQSYSEETYTLHEINLQVGDTLYMTTDGWIDVINPERKRFGSQKFREMLLQGTSLPLKAQKELFSHIIDEYEQGAEQRDDVLLVGVKI